MFGNKHLIKISIQSVSRLILIESAVLFTVVIFYFVMSFINPYDFNPLNTVHLLGMLIVAVIFEILILFYNLKDSKEYMSFMEITDNEITFYTKKRGKIIKKETVLKKDIKNFIANIEIEDSLTNPHWTKKYDMNVSVTTTKRLIHFRLNKEPSNSKYLLLNLLKYASLIPKFRYNITGLYARYYPEVKAPFEYAEKMGLKMTLFHYMKHEWKLTLIILIAVIEFLVIIFCAVVCYKSL